MSSFIKNIFLSTSLIIIIGLFPFMSWGKDYWYEIICAFSISLINAIVGYYLVLISIDKSNHEFYKNVYGGMLIRMVVVFGFSIYMIKSNSVLATPYMLFLITFYVVHQWTEILGWLKELPKKNIQFYK